MNQLTKTPEGGLLIEDTDSGDRVQLSWEEVGRMLVFIEEDLAKVGARAARPVTDALERGVELERAELGERA